MVAVEEAVAVEAADWGESFAVDAGNFDVGIVAAGAFDVVVAVPAFPHAFADAAAGEDIHVAGVDGHIEDAAAAAAGDDPADWD